MTHLLQYLYRQQIDDSLLPNTCYYTYTLVYRLYPKHYQFILLVHLQYQQSRSVLYRRVTLYPAELLPVVLGLHIMMVILYYQQSSKFSWTLLPATLYQSRGVDSCSYQQKQSTTSLQRVESTVATLGSRVEHYFSTLLSCRVLLMVVQRSYVCRALIIIYPQYKKQRGLFFFGYVNMTSL